MKSESVCARAAAVLLVPTFVSSLSSVRFHTTDHFKARSAPHPLVTPYYSEEKTISFDCFINLRAAGCDHFDFLFPSSYHQPFWSSSQECSCSGTCPGLCLKFLSHKEQHWRQSSFSLCSVVKLQPNPLLQIRLLYLPEFLSPSPTVCFQQRTSLSGVPHA